MSNAVNFNNGVMTIESGTNITLDMFTEILEFLGINIYNDVICCGTAIEGMSDSYSDINAHQTLPTLLSSEIKAAGGSLSDSVIEKYLFNIADVNRRNPVMEMITSIPWDGNDRFEELMSLLTTESTYFEDYDIYYSMLEKWLIQSVAMANNALNRRNQLSLGADGCLVLQGPEGIGKTSFFRKLAMFREWFKEGVTLNVTNKDAHIAATSGWIVELGELDATMKKKQSRIKSIVTGDMDEIRSFYARKAVVAPRHTSLCATVNPKDFLSETAGTRRWWVIPVTDIDLTTLNSLSNDWLQQLWAQAYDRFVNDKDSFRLTENERNIISKLNAENFTTERPFEEDVRASMDFTLPRTAWTEHTAAEIAQHIREEYNCTLTSEALGKIMKQLMKENPGIIKRKSNGKQLYRCPLIK